jgi:hypothetical protein
VLSGAHSSSTSASAPVTRCSSPHRRSLDYEATTNEHQLDDAIHKAFHPTLYSDNSPMVYEKNNVPVFTSSSTSMATTPTTSMGFDMTGSNAMMTNYRTGPISLPSSPTHRQYPNDNRVHRWNHTAHHPYAVPSRPYGHSRQNSLTNRRSLGMASEGYALPLVNPNTMISTTPATTINHGTGGTSANSNNNMNHMTNSQISTSVSLGSNPSSSSSSTYPSITLGTVPSTSVLNTPTPTGSSGSISSNVMSNSMEIDNGNNSNAIATLERLRRRRENHNHVERRRRDHINGTIRALASLLPDRGRGADGQRRNKGAILESAVDWLREVQRENALLHKENTMLRERCGLTPPTTGSVNAVVTTAVPTTTTINGSVVEAGSEPNGTHPFLATVSPAQPSGPSVHPHHGTMYARNSPTSMASMPMPINLADRSASAPNPIMHTSAGRMPKVEEMKPQLPGLSTLFAK